MKTLKLFLLLVLESFEFARLVIRYALIFVSAFFRQRASLGCEMVAIRSQLTFYEESIRQKRQPRPRFHPALRLLWVLLSSVWTGWKSAAELMKPKTLLKWHENAFLNWWRFDFATANAHVQRGDVDLVSFARHYISNPDLVGRFQSNHVLAPSDPKTYHTGGPNGYTDYPFASSES